MFSHRKCTWIMLLTLLLLGLCGTAAAADPVYVNEELFIHIGRGSLGLPDAYGTPADWTLGAEYVLIENVSMSQLHLVGFAPIGDSLTPFTGKFNGQNHTISNLNLVSAAGYTGLFGCTDSAEIKNVILDNVTISTSDSYAGSLTGQTDNTIVENCHVYGKLTAVITGDESYEELRYIGGFVGEGLNSTFSDCSASIDITGTTAGGTGRVDFYRFGGFSGDSRGSSYIDCHASGNITLTAAGFDIFSLSNAGGFSGSVYDSTFSNCSSSGDITGGFDGRDVRFITSSGFTGYAYGSTFSNCSSLGNIIVAGAEDSVTSLYFSMNGGFAGESSRSTYIDCFALGDMKSTIAGRVTVESSDNGGFIGASIADNINKCFAAGDIEITDGGQNLPSGRQASGGFIGALFNSNVSNCYATGNVTGVAAAGGFAGFISYTNDYGLMTASITNCYAVGNVSGRGANVGGFAGNMYTFNYDKEAAISYSFYREDNGGGNNGYAVPKCSEDLMKIETFKNAPKNQNDPTISAWDILSVPPEEPSIWYILVGQEYPRFNWDSYSITYDGNGNTVGSAPVSPRSYALNEEAVILGRGSLEKTGHTFIGWKTDGVTPEEEYQPGDARTMISDIVLFAQWKLNETSPGSGGGNRTGNATVVPPGGNNSIDRGNVTNQPDPDGGDETRLSPIPEFLDSESITVILFFAIAIAVFCYRRYEEAKEEKHQ
ncbi:MAG: InlB B-repeat-containing protein [Methanosarcinales archaeon]|nr:InlB B-repeat-containing protein [Methanosarcinales archaeon]